MKTTRNWKTAPISGRSTRFGMTLIEIMAAILVLSIGLVGVISAIPFGGLRMSQMQEADNSSALGRNAARVMKSNGWANPANWWVKNNNNGSYPSSDPSGRGLWYNAADNTYRINLKYPFLLDPLGKETNPTDPIFPEFCDLNAAPNSVVVDGREVGRVTNPFLTRVRPALGNLYNYRTLVEAAFYLQDDLVYGYSDSEDETFYRPRVESIASLVGDVEGAAPFSGRYTWLATVRPKNASGSFVDCQMSDIAAADYDVVVLQNRIPGDERAFDVVEFVGGYQGGTVTLDLDGGGYFLSPRPEAASGSERAVEQLESTRYIMLMGEEDIPEGGHYRAFARWYKIANYAVVETNGGEPTKVRMTLIGPTTPSYWATGAKPVKALFFPGAIGVYSGTANF